MNFRQSVSWTFLGKSIFLGCQFLLVVFLSKATSMFTLGAYSLGLAITGPVFIFSSLQLRVILATEKNPLSVFWDFFVLRMILSALAVPVVYVAGFAMALDEDVFLIVVFCSALKFFDSVADIVYGLYQGVNRMDLMAKSQIIRSVLGLILFIFSFLLFKNAQLSFLVMIISYAVVIIFFDFVRARYKYNLLENVYVSIVKSLGRSRSIFIILKKGVPLGLVVMVGSLSANIPSYIIESKLSIEAVAVFASLIYLVQSTSTFMSALWEPAVPRLTRMREAFDYLGFTKMIAQISLAGLAIGMIGFFVVLVGGKFILFNVFNEDFAKHYDVFLALTSVLVVRNLGGVWSVGATVLRYYWVQVPINVLNAVLILISCYFLVPTQGLIGAAYALLICTTVTRLLFLSVIAHGVISMKHSVNLAGCPESSVNSYKDI